MPFANGNSKKRSSRWGSSSTSSVTDPIQKLNNQIDNARLRAQDSGFNANPDKRNWFEKATNLPQGQNGFLDALEIIQRPFQAVMNVVDKVPMKERGLGEAAWRGFSGADRVRGAEFVEKRGIDDPLAKAVLGTALEIGLDPLTYVPGGLIVKGVKAAAKPVATGLKAGYGALENTSPAVKNFRTNVVQPNALKARDSLGYMFNRDYKIDETLSGGKSDALKIGALGAENTRKFMQEESLKNVTDAARKAGGIDTGVEAGRIMEKPLRQFDDVEMFELPDGIRRTTSKRELKNEIIGNQQRIKELGQVVRESNKEIDNKISTAAKALEKNDKDLRRMFMSVENKKLKTLQKTDPKSLVKPKLLRGFTPSSPAVNLLIKRGDEIKAQLDSVRAELGLPKVRKKSYTPEQMQKLATDRTFKQLSPSPAFNLLLQRSDEFKTELTQLRELRKTSGQDEIANINRLVDENAAIKESAKNPLMVQREIPRVERELSGSKEITEAARTLAKGNQAIREYALENGIKIPELEGYMTHVLTQAEKQLRKNNRISSIDSGSFGSGNPNKKILSERQNKGSVEDINELAGRDKFQANAYFATAIGQKRLIDYIQAVKFRKEVLTNPDFAQPYKKGMVIPENSTIIDSANYSFIKPADDILEGTVDAGKIGGEYVVTKAAKNALDKFNKINTDEGTKAFIKAFDAATVMWKKFALFSFGYHARNSIGAMFNNYVGGMNPIDLAKYTPLATKEVTAALRGSESAMYREYRLQGLGATSQNNMEFLSGADPEKAIEKMVKERSKDLKGKVLDRVNPLRAFETSREIGSYIDQTNRYAAYKWAREKLKLSPEKAAEKVREFQFDYSKLSPFEQNVMARVIPFYRWMRNNIPFQIKQFIHDPKKYAAINKLRLNAQESFGIEDDNMPDFMKEQFILPVSDDKYLSLGLPLNDLLKLNAPVKNMGLGGLNPLLKTPIELASNRNTFLGKPIEKFEGQKKQFQVPSTNVDFGVPSKVAYAVEQLGGQLGRGFSKFLQKPEDVDQDVKYRLKGTGISSILKDYDVDKAMLSQKYQELKELQDYISYIEQQTGTRPRSVKEIRK